MVPADDHAIVLPWASVIVIMVLLNVAFTCATPDAMFFFSRRRTRVASLPILILVVPGRSGSYQAFTRVISSCRRLPWPAPYGCARSYACAGREPEGRGGGANRDSNRDPSAA